MNSLDHAALSAVSARQLAATEADVRACEADYQGGAREPAFWAMVDLRGSSRFRLASGDRDAYVRVEAFTRLVRRLLAGYGDAAPFKELGDAVLVRATGLRPVLEAAAVLDMVARSWTANHLQDGLRMDARVAVTHGTAVRLRREGFDDYVGAPLDRLARLSGQGQAGDVLALVDEQTVTVDGAVFAEYAAFALRGPLVLDAGLLKAGEKPVRYHEVVVDRPALARTTDNFVPLRR